MFRSGRSTETSLLRTVRVKTRQAKSASSFRPLGAVVAQEIEVEPADRVALCAGGRDSERGKE